MESNQNIKIGFYKNDDQLKREYLKLKFVPAFIINLIRNIRKNG